MRCYIEAIHYKLHKNLPTSIFIYLIIMDLKGKYEVGFDMENVDPHRLKEVG